MTKDILDIYFTSYDLKRLAMYSNNMADYHLIMDLLPSLARLYFLNMMGDTNLSAVQSVFFIFIMFLMFFIEVIMFKYNIFIIFIVLIFIYRQFY